MKSKRVLDRILRQVGLGLAELREKSGHRTLKDFVLQHQLPEVQYWRIEKGKTNITLKSLMKILAIHKLSLHEFFYMISETSLRQDR